MRLRKKLSVALSKKQNPITPLHATAQKNPIRILYVPQEIGTRTAHYRIGRSRWIGFPFCSTRVKHKISSNNHADVIKLETLQPVRICRESDVRGNPGGCTDCRLQPPV